MNGRIEMLTGGAAVALVLLVGGCDQSGSSGMSSPNSPEARADKHGEEIMASNAKAEAREWMKNPSHVFFKADARQIGGFVEDFYGAGAAQVLIADVEEHEGKQFGGCLLVVLPADPPARAKLFAVGSRIEKVMGEDHVRDKGQKYLYYSLD